MPNDNKAYAKREKAYMSGPDFCAAKLTHDLRKL